MYTCITGVSESKLPEINKLYYKYKSNIETILLHPEISSHIVAVQTTLCKRSRCLEENLIFVLLLKNNK